MLLLAQLPSEAESVGDVSLVGKRRLVCCSCSGRLIRKVIVTPGEHRCKVLRDTAIDMSRGLDVIKLKMRGVPFYLQKIGRLRADLATRIALKRCALQYCATIRHRAT